MKEWSDEGPGVAFVFSRRLWAFGMKANDANGRLFAFGPFRFAYLRHMT